MTGYAKDIELMMQRMFASLPEKDRGIYAAIEAAKLTPGGIEYVSSLFGIDVETVRRGLVELELMEDVGADRKLST